MQNLQILKNNNLYVRHIYSKSASQTKCSLRSFSTVHYRIWRYIIVNRYASLRCDGRSITGIPELIESIFEKLISGPKRVNKINFIETNDLKLEYINSKLNWNKYKTTFKI